MPKLKTNIIYQVAYEIFVIAMPLFLSPYVSRVLGATGIGIYSYTQSIATYFVLFSMLGIKNYGNRVIAQVKDNKEKLNETFSSLLRLHIIVSLLCVCIYFCYIPTTDEYRIYFAIQGLYVLSGLFDITWFYFGIEQFKISVLRNLVVKLFTFASIFLFVKQEDDLLLYCGILSGGFLLSQLFLWIPLYRFVQLVKCDWSVVWGHLKPMLVLFLPTIAISLYRYMSRIMLGVLDTPEQVGFFSNSDQIISVPTALIAAFGTVMLPRMSNLRIKNDNSQFERNISLSMKYLMCISIGMGFGMAAVAHNFAPIFWGEDFSDCGKMIKYLSIVIPFVAFANILRTQYLIPFAYDKQYTISVFIGAIANILVNWLFIPIMGGMGAVLGAIAAECTVCLVQCIYVKRQLPLKSYVVQSMPFVLFGIIMLACVMHLSNLFDNAILSLLFQILIGMVIYVSLSLGYLFKDKLYNR